MFLAGSRDRVAFTHELEQPGGGHSWRWGSVAVNIPAESITTAFLCQQAGKVFRPKKECMSLLKWHMSQHELFRDCMHKLNKSVSLLLPPP